MSSLHTHIASSGIHNPSTPSGNTIPQSHSESDDTSVPNPTGIGELSSPAKLLLSADKDARQIVRLVQCPVCSNILQEPTTLPCGHSLCKRCVPQTHVRTNISWPATAGRLQGFGCPFADCKKEHAIGDCGIDVTLNKVLAIIRGAIEQDRDVTAASATSTHIAVRDPWRVAGVSSLAEKEPESVVLKGSRIVATYTMAELGKLKYSAEVSYASVSASGAADQFDNVLLAKLKESARSEVDCQVCYAIFLDPMTTTCGHTFCRPCVQRMLDHSDLCPICRRSLSIQPQAAANGLPSNERLVQLINGFWAELVVLREQAYRLEQQANNSGFDIPIFVCTLAFPHMPTFLHVFEPRYRLMLRRAMEGNRTFGMVLPRQSPNPDGPDFAEYGTLLRIINIEYFPDGRSLIETRGVSRFRVTRHGYLDGYVVANIEKIDDISVAEEEAIEASETMRVHGIQNFAVHPEVPETETAPTDSGQSASPRSLVAPISLEDLDVMSTQELVDYVIDFVARMRARSVSWLLPRIIDIYGECPSSPLLFPWWFASLLPVRDKEKYKLLSTTSVRQRMKICCGWIIEWESSRWSVPSRPPTP